MTSGKSILQSRNVNLVIQHRLKSVLKCMCTLPCRVGEQTPKWYKFDDGEVSECKMDDDEEMKNQCFGGEYLGEVFDHMLKR